MNCVTSINAAAGIPQLNPDGWLSSARMTAAYLRDPLGVMRDAEARHGPVFAMNMFGMKAVVLLGTEANREVLLNPAGAFSSELGWSPLIGGSFPQGLISLDGERHREDRRIIGAAFKPDPMQRYLDVMDDGIHAALGCWPEELDVYPAYKRLTLDLAARALLGLPLGRQSDEVNRAFAAMLGASTAIVRRPIPGGALWRGIRARKRLSRILRSHIAERRARPGIDIFSTICNLRDEQGRFLPDESIVNHMNLLLMAAHDTTSSVLTSLTLMLGPHIEWQDRVRDEMASFLARHRGRFDYEALRELTVTDMVLNETLRLYPPVPSLPRGLTRDIAFAGHVIPAGTSVGIHILHTHYSPEHFPAPRRFDPYRFMPEAVKARDRFAWLPFGGGAHMCLGLHFASVQVKLILGELLLRRRITLRSDDPVEMQWLPIARPRRGLPVRLTKI